MDWQRFADEFAPEIRHKGNRGQITKQYAEDMGIDVSKITTAKAKTARRKLLVNGGMRDVPQPSQPKVLALLNKMIADGEIDVAKLVAPKKVASKKLKDHQLSENHFRAKDCIKKY